MEERSRREGDANPVGVWPGRCPPPCSADQRQVSGENGTLGGDRLGLLISQPSCPEADSVEVISSPEGWGGEGEELATSVPLLCFLPSPCPLVLLSPHPSSSFFIPFPFPRHPSGATFFPTLYAYLLSVSSILTLSSSLTSCATTCKFPNSLSESPDLTGWL